MGRGIIDGLGAGARLTSSLGCAGLGFGLGAGVVIGGRGLLKTSGGGTGRPFSNTDDCGFGFGFDILGR